MYVRTYFLCLLTQARDSQTALFLLRDMGSTYSLLWVWYTASNFRGDQNGGQLLILNVCMIMNSADGHRMGEY